MSRKTQIDLSIVGQTIKMLRVKNYLTQQELADRLGYSVRNLRRIETNGPSSIDVVNLIANEFDVSAIEILDGSLLFYINNRKSPIGMNTSDFRHTVLTLICYSYMCTLG